MSNKGVDVTMIPAHVPTENLIIIASQKKIGLLYTKLGSFDSHVLDLVTGDDSCLHYATYADGLVLIDVNSETINFIISEITNYRVRAKEHRETDVYNRLYIGAMRMIKNGGKVDE